MEKVNQIVELVKKAEALSKTVKSKEQTLSKALPYALESFRMALDRGIRDLKERALKEIADRYITEHMPNSGLTGEAICRELDEEDRDSFNVSKLLGKLKEHSGNARQASLENLRTVARRLLPNMQNKKGYWGPVEDPKQIRRGNALTLRAYTWDEQFKEVSYSAYTAFQEIAALDKLAQVILRDADPLTVESAASEVLETARRNKEPFYGRKWSINFFEVEFYKNGHAKAVFTSERVAKRIAKELVG